MNKLILRRLIYIFFIIVFLVASPLVILYTMGYRYNFGKQRIQKTGIIKITSLPRGAEIYLNGTKYEKTATPAKIEYVLPGDYEIKLIKDGYFEWQKKLSVYENGTTFAEKIMLWKKSEAETISTSTIIDSLTSPDNNFIISITQTGEIILTDINSGLVGEISGGKNTIIGQIKNYHQFTLQEFSGDSRYLLLKAETNKQKDYFVLDTVIKKYQKIDSGDYNSIKWNQQNNELYAISDNKLLRFNLNNGQATIYLNKISINDFLLAGRSFYVINKGLLSEYNLKGEKIKDIASIECLNNCQLKTITNNKAIIIDNNKLTMELVDLDSKIKNIKINAQKIDWLDSSSVMLYGDYEIFIFDSNKNEPELITRLGNKIKYAIWHPKGRHLILSFDDKIKIMELDNRELRNVIDIKEASADFLISDRAGKNIFYTVDKVGIFKLNIQ